MSEISYYGRPLLKAPVWEWAVPTYFFVGGTAGAAMTLGMVAHNVGQRRLAERCRWIGAIGGGIGSALLIYDLGRMSRFLYMLRVFRPTSPMSVGSWVLTLATPLSLGSALFHNKPLGDAAGLLGMPLATYTGVLLGVTALPGWYEQRRKLPVLFAASSLASLGSLLELMRNSPAEERVVRRVATVGRAAEVAIAGHVSAATVLTAASLLVSILPGGKRKRIVAGVLGMAGSLALRWEVFHSSQRCR